MNHGRSCAAPPRKIFFREAAFSFASFVVRAAVDTARQMGVCCVSHMLLV